MYYKPILPLLLVTTLLASCNSNSTKDQHTVTSTEESTTPTVEQAVSTINTGVAEQIGAFILPGYELMDTLSGDLNLDGRMDYLLVLKQKGEADAATDVQVKRPLLLLIADENNQLQLARRNDHTVYCMQCGGMMGDPYNGLAIKDGYFSIQHYGGSAWRWTRVITYKYDQKAQEWYLHKDGSENFHASEPENVTEEIKTTKDFGQVKFEAFDIYKEQ